MRISTSWGVMLADTQVLSLVPSSILSLSLSAPPNWSQLPGTLLDTSLINEPFSAAFLPLLANML